MRHRQADDHDHRDDARRRAHVHTDDFYSCSEKPGPFVKDIDAARMRLAQLADDSVVCCTAAPVCPSGRWTYASEADCEAEASACQENTVCCTTIWCGSQDDRADSGTADDAGSHDDAG